MHISQTNIIKLTILLGLFVLLGCGSFLDFKTTPKFNRNVEVIASKEEQPDAWMLSPTGDKLVYRTGNPASLFLLDTQTQQKHNLNDNKCERFRWLDNTLLLCTNYNSASLIVADDDFKMIPLQQIDGQKTDVANLLDDKLIYRFKDEPAFIVLNRDYREHPNENYYITVGDVEATLQGRTSITIPDPGWQAPLIQLGEKLYSPNQEFYFTKITQNFVAIHKAPTDEELSEFSDRDPNVIQFIGWAADSSGVYVALIPGGMFNDPRKGLYKLKVPLEPTSKTSDLSQPIPTDTPFPTPMATNTPVPPTFAAEGRIAFRSTRNKVWDIYAINPDGSGLVNMSNHPGRDWDFVWSPDGSRLALISSRNDDDPEGCSTWCTTDIYTVNAEGDDLTRLTNVSAMNRSPAWSPDGTRIAFASSRDEADPSACPFKCNFEIYMMNADGSEQTRLTNNPKVDNWPNWSPDGKRIAFTSYRDGNAEIYVMNADGSGQMQLTDNPASDLWPVWSPDGSRIAFVSDRNYPDTECILAECQYDIYVMAVPANGGPITPESNLIQLHQTNSFFVNLFSVWWSPDSKKILSHIINDGNYGIYVVNADGSDLVYLTDDSANNLSPVWSPDGTQMAFTSERDGNAEIYIMNMDGSHPTRLTNDPATDFQPIWSPQ